jgi:Arc/MetJ-type ribon-helix-helix transcriptional regulator
MMTDQTMPTTEVVVPDKVDTEISQLVERDEFLNREQAIEELLSMGISAYDTGRSTTEESGEDVFTQSMDDQHDPAMDTGQGDDYTF